MSLQRGLWAGLIFLVGCAGSTHWVKPGGSAEQAQAELSACRAEARRADAASSRRDYIVSADRSGMDASRGVERGRLEMRDEVSAYNRRKKVEADVDACMISHGWRRGQS